MKRPERPRRPRSAKSAAPAGTAPETYILNLQAQAGNRAVTSLLTDAHPTTGPQREFDSEMAAVQRESLAGWKDADKRGEAWNAKTHDVGDIRRIPLEGLTLGNDKASAGTEMSRTTESAAGKAIVLIPSSVKGGQQVDVLLHFHGYTGEAKRPYAGWRQHSRSGTVRDVDQDRIEAQLQASGQKSMIAVLPQGVGGSSFNNLKPETYLPQVFDRLSAVQEPPDPTGTFKPLTRGRLVLSGHSGGGDRIAQMLDSATGFGASEIVLFEAIHRGGLDMVMTWATKHLNRVVAALKKTSDTNARKKVVDSCPKLLGYYTAADPKVDGSGMYVKTYEALEKQLDAWFTDFGGGLGADREEIRAHFRVEKITGAAHEGLIRGIGDDPLQGPLTDALMSLDRPRQQADKATSKLVRSGKSTAVLPNDRPQVGPAPEPKNGPVGPPPPKRSPTPPPAPGPASIPKASRSGRRSKRRSSTAPSSGSGSPAAASLPSISLSPERIIGIAFARGLGPLQILATMPKIVQGGDSYRVLAETLVAGGLRDTVEIADALFDVAHPELGGGRIATRRLDLRKQWVLLRRRYARPAVSSAKRASTTAPDVPATAPASATTPAAAKTPAKAPAAIKAPAKTPPPTVDIPSTPPVAVDPKTVRPAKAATGSKELTEDEQKKAMADALHQATTEGSKSARRDIDAVLAKYSLDVTEWFAGINFSASFLDVPIIPSGGDTPGVHEELLARLRMAEAILAKQFPGLSKAQIAGKMGIYEVSGIRPPKAATGATQPSAHCFGLAVDINHPTNPFVGNNKPKKKKNMTDDERAKYQELLTHRSPRVIERAMLLLRQENFNIEGSLGHPKNMAEAGQLWEKHHRASETLAEYLRLADDLGGQKLSDAVTALRNKGDQRTLDDWKTLIADDRKLLKYWDFEHHKSPQKGGYLDLGQELVVALIGAGLLWGGSYEGDKDIMHFDWRGGTIKDRSS